MSLKKFFINIIIIILILTAAEMWAFYSFRNQYFDLIEQQSRLFENPEKFIKDSTPHYMSYSMVTYEKLNEKLKTRTADSNKSTKRPVITMGCSYTFGSCLKNNQTFAYKINELTGRKVYNRGVEGSGIQWVYGQLSNENFQKEVPDAEYVIYTFITDHIARQFNTFICPYIPNIDLNYINHNGILTERKHPLKFLYRSFLVKKFFLFYKKIKVEIEYRNGFPLFLTTLKLSVEEMHKKYPNSKFVFIEFPQQSICFPDYEEGSQELRKEIIKEIEKLGIKYIKASELVGHNFCEKEYRLNDNDHPSEYTWDILTPLIVKELGL